MTPRKRSTSSTLSLIASTVDSLYDRGGGCQWRRTRRPRIARSGSTASASRTSRPIRRAPRAATREVLTCATDTGSGGYTHRYFRAPTSADDLVAARDAIAAWARLTYGWMGRSPDYKAAFLATLGANADFYAPYQDNARRWYRAAQEHV